MHFSINVAEEGAGWNPAADLGCCFTTSSPWAGHLNCPFMSRLISDEMRMMGTRASQVVGGSDLYTEDRAWGGVGMVSTQGEPTLMGRAAQASPWKVPQVQNETGQASVDCTHTNHPARCWALRHPCNPCNTLASRPIFQVGNRCREKE